ncbi:MAG: alpha-E domain-containing protein [Alphaproteobacteria bacterium]|nr:alpha-E domain-containing protein [Alphaproteobacteria bacterium]
MKPGEPGTELLARYAESIFWLARYVERAENLARILDVQESFSRDTPGAKNWFSIVQLYADEGRYFEHHSEASAAGVIDFYVMNLENPSSIISTIRMARENARTLRPLISTEMWTHLNVFYNQLRGTASSRMALSELSRLCAVIKENCQTHTGITEGTFFRDQGWLFYELGRAIERADQTTRVVDIKYHLLLPQRDEVGRILDINQWHTLLRSLAGYHAYRRHYPSGMSAKSVVEFLLLNPEFPRSLALCADRIIQTLASLRSRFDLHGGARAIESAESFIDKLQNARETNILAMGLNEFLDGVQIDLVHISANIAAGFFGHDAEQGSGSRP